MTKLLAASGLMIALDRSVVAAYCVAWARWVECEEQVAKNGLILRMPSGYMIHSPYLTIANKAMDQMRQLGEQIGLSASARSRINALDAVAGEDPGEAFLRGRA